MRLGRARSGPIIMSEGRRCISIRIAVAITRQPKLLIFQDIDGTQVEPRSDVCGDAIPQLAELVALRYVWSARVSSQQPADADLS
jgi:hypothetical protein